ncbi:MAG TPA: glycosyltransferase family A protein [Verrucomicrobiae bacterium]
MKILKTPERMRGALVSILIPAYNAERWIADTVDSALQQTWRNREIIVVDDGSSDRTAAIAGNFLKDGVMVITQKNQGASAARNKAFAHSNGDFIQWLDADDLIAPDKIARQMEVAERIADPYVLISAEWGRFMYRARHTRFSKSRLWENLAPAEWLFRKLGENLFMPPQTWLVSRELTEAAGRWDERLSLDDDGEYFSRVVIASKRICFVPGAKVFYRAAGSGSLSDVDQSKRKLESLWLSLQLQIRRLQQLEDSERTRAACVIFLENWLKFFYPWRLDIVEEAQQLAESLGGHLSIPRLRRKYAWIEKFSNRRTAARVEEFVPNLRANLARFWDRSMFQFEQIGRA